MRAGLLWDEHPPNSGQRRGGVTGPRGRTKGCSISPPAADPPDSEAQGSAAADTSFHDRALGATLNPLEHIDRLFHHTSRRIWLGILGTAILIAAGVVWTAVAKQVQTVQANAVIVPRAGLFTVETAQVGQVSALPVRVGSDVSQGQPLVTLARPGAGRTNTVPSPVPGVVVSVDVRVGDIVQAGVPLFLIAPRGAAPMAIGLYPAAKIDQISVGQQAEVAVNGVDPSKYGFALSRVVAIGPIPVTD
jgi:multidrug resistance efflux pump